MLRYLLIFFCKSFKTNTQLKLEVLFLTKQIEILKRKNFKLEIRKSDRFFFSLIKNILTNWKERLYIVKPNTVIKWHRNSFRLYWAWKSKRIGGRPKTEKEIIDLIKQISNENPLWGVARIHGELLKLGIEVSQSTVQRYMSKRNGKTTRLRWKTFLKIHVKEDISIDFLTIPTFNYKLLHVLVIIEHNRRKIIQFNVTKHPTAEGTIQHSRNLLFNYAASKYLGRDRDGKYGKPSSEGINKFGIKQIITSYKSPWQNGYAERVIGSLKRECVDHVILLNENYLRSVLTDYISYYNKYRTHLGSNKDSPEGREVQPVGSIDKIDAVDGLHHIIFRKAI